MKLEFIKDSEELKAFESQLSFITSQDEEYNDGDGRDFVAIFQHKEDGKYYSSWMHQGNGTYSKQHFISHHRNYKKDEPYVVTFEEVKPVEVTYTEYKPVEDSD